MGEWLDGKGGGWQGGKGGRMVKWKRSEIPGFIHGRGTQGSRWVHVFVSDVNQGNDEV